MRIFAVIALWLGLVVSANAQYAFRPLTSFNFTSNVTGTASPVTFINGTQFVRALCSVSCFFGLAVTNVQSGASNPSFLAPMEREYFRAQQGMWVVVRTLNQNGTIYITAVE